MRILLITQWYDPEPTFKGQQFASALRDRGHDVVVVTGFPNYPGGRLYPGYRIRPLQCENLDGVTVIRVPLYPSHDSSGLRRAVNYVSFAAFAAVACLAVKRPDVAYVYHPPASVALPAMLLKMLKGVPFVYDVQDLWPDTLAATGMLGNGKALRVVDEWMRHVYRRASKIVVLSRGFAERLKDRGVSTEKIEVVPNWTYESGLAAVDHSPQAAAELGFEGRFNVVFAGTMGATQALDVVLDSAVQLQDADPDVRFVLIGGGIEVTRLEAEAEARGLGNVVFLPRRPASEIGEILYLADCLLIHLREDPLFEITVPSKTQSSLLTGKAILMGVRGDAATIVRESGSGIVFTPEDPGDLTRAVRELKSWSPERRAEAGEAGRRCYLETMSLARGVEEFERLLTTAAAGGSRSEPAIRALDTVAASSALALLLGPMAVVATLVRLKLGSPVLFRQTRPGRYGQPFEMMKFRTMTDARDSEGRLLPDSERLTPFGRLLRSTSLDELPELLNVIKGDMSLVGPRPLLLRYTPFFTNEERLRLEVPPGITGWAQVNGRNAASWDDRLALDVWYVRHRTLGRNLSILVRTVAKVFKREGLVVDPESVMKNLDDERRSKGANS